MSKSINTRKVRLKFYDPDAGRDLKELQGGWPVVEGKLVAKLTGTFNKTWYIMKLDNELFNFDPYCTGQARGKLIKKLQYLILIPPDEEISECKIKEVKKAIADKKLFDIDLPPDTIGEAMKNKTPVDVGVLAGDEPQKVPDLITTEDSTNNNFPYYTLLSGKLTTIENY